MIEEVKTRKRVPQRKAYKEGNFYEHDTSRPGMNERIRALREESVNTPASLSIERALIQTEFYKTREDTQFR